MLRKFIFGSGVFALSVLAFSLIRQIIVFPAISRYSDDLFVELTFMVFTFEAIAYGFTGAIPDYYVRRLQGSGVDAVLMRKLSKLCLTSLASFVGFFLFGLGFIVSLLLSIYLCLFSLNALKIKIVFNKLQFAENFVYMAFRSIPYLVLLWATYSEAAWIKGEELKWTAGLLLITEACYFFRLKSITRQDMENAIPVYREYEIQDSLFYSILPFIVSALMMGFIQRGDLTIVKLLDTSYYTGYAKLILTVNFFCAPLALMISSPLLSFMSRYDLSLKSPDMHRIIGGVAILVAAISLTTSLSFNFVYAQLYAGSYNGSTWFIFFITAMTLSYALVRTLTTKYAKAKPLLLTNILLVLILALLSKLISIQIFVVFFYTARVFIYSGLLLIDAMKIGPNKTT